MLNTFSRWARDWNMGSGNEWGARESWTVHNLGNYTLTSAYSPFVQSAYKSNWKDTKTERDSGDDTAYNSDVNDRVWTELGACREWQHNLRPRVRSSHAKRQRRSDEMHHKHGVNLSTNHSTG